MGVMEEEDFRQYSPQQSFHKRAGACKIVFLTFAIPFQNMFLRFCCVFCSDLVQGHVSWTDVALDPLSFAILCVSPRRG